MADTKGQNRCALERMVALVQELKAGSNLKKIAARFEVSHKTLHRDLTFLRDRLGLRAEFNPSQNRWVLQGAEAFDGLQASILNH